MKSAVIAYIPALHKGYIDFFKKHSEGALYLLGMDLVLEVPRLERDIRAVTAIEMQKLISALNIFKKVNVLTKENLVEVTGVGEIIMPDEDVSHAFAEKYLPDANIQYIPTFLRWDKHSALKENAQANPDRIISRDAFDREMMTKALAEAQKSSDWWRQIGALIVRDGRILFIGHNKPLPSEGVHNIFGDPRSNFDYGVSFELSKFLHAEAGLIAEAAKRGISLDGAHLYVTTFPCPVCAKSVAVSGIKKVYYSEGYSLLDAEDILKSYNIEIIQVKP